MKFRIYYNDEDELIIEGETIEEIREIAFAECERRGWERNKCWSEKIEG